MRRTTQSRQAGDQGQEERSILCVEGDIEKHIPPIDRSQRFRGEHSRAGLTYSSSLADRRLSAGPSQGAGGSSYSPSSLKILCTISRSSWVAPMERSICSAVAGGLMFFAMTRLYHKSGTWGKRRSRGRGGPPEAFGVPYLSIKRPKKPSTARKEGEMPKPDGPPKRAP